MPRILPPILLALACCLPLSATAVQQYQVRVLEQMAASRDNFVQGLEIDDGYLYVSTGHYGKSRLLRYRLADGELDRLHQLHPALFGEGLTVLGDAVYQLTWRNRTMLVYRRGDLVPLRSQPLPGEGWGLTNDGENLIYSDGSHYLHTMSPTGQVLRSLPVTEHGRPLRKLNELEWIDGMVWANVWQTHRIVIIDPASGEVTGSIDLRGLLPASEYRQGTDVLNGIARNPADGGIWVTGKRWPWLYRIELQAVPEQQDAAVSR